MSILIAAQDRDDLAKALHIVPVPSAKQQNPAIEQPLQEHAVSFYVCHSGNSGRILLFPTPALQVRPSAAADLLADPRCRRKFKPLPLLS